SSSSLSRGRLARCTRRRRRRDRPPCRPRVLDWRTCGERRVLSEPVEALDKNGDGRADLCGGGAAMVAGLLAGVAQVLVYGEDRAVMRCAAGAGREHAVP